MPYFTADEFKTAILNCKLPNCDYIDYYPSWLCPDGRIYYTGAGHSSIARELIDEHIPGGKSYDGLYATLWKQDFFRLAPSRNLTWFCIENTRTGAKINSKQKATLAMMLRLWDIKKGNEGYSSTYVDSAIDYRTPNSRTAFLRDCQEVYSGKDNA